VKSFRCRWDIFAQLGNQIRSDSERTRLMHGKLTMKLGRTRNEGPPEVPTEQSDGSTNCFDPRLSLIIISACRALTLVSGCDSAIWILVLVGPWYYIVFVQISI